MQVSEEDRERRQDRITPVIDDDPVAGFAVMIAPRGEEAITPIDRIHQPVAILLDVNLDPAERAVDGYETCQRIRESDGDLKAPVIFFTVRKTREYVKRALAVGDDSFVTKPVVDVALLERVVDALGQGKLDRRCIG